MAFSGLEQQGKKVSKTIIAIIIGGIFTILAALIGAGVFAQPHIIMEDQKNFSSVCPYEITLGYTIEISNYGKAGAARNVKIQSNEIKFKDGLEWDEKKVYIPKESSVTVQFLVQEEFYKRNPQPMNITITHFIYEKTSIRKNMMNRDFIIIPCNFTKVENSSLMTLIRD